MVEQSPKILDFVGQPIVVGSVVVYPLKSGSSAAHLREGVVTAIEYSIKEGYYTREGWKISIERVEEDWYLQWHHESRGANPTWKIIRTTLHFPDRLTVIPETPACFWMRHGVRTAFAPPLGQPKIPIIIHHICDRPWTDDHAASCPGVLP